MNSATFTADKNTKIVVNSSAFSQTPIAKYLWHDLFAFCKYAVPVYETSTDNNTWVASELNKNHFAQKDSLSINVIGATGKSGSRWTWNSVKFYNSSGIWLVIGFAYSSQMPNVSVLFETSVDGTTWTTRHSSTHSSGSSPVWFRVDSFSPDTYLRLTLTKDPSDTTKYCNIGAIKLLSYRWGDQGGGSEYEYPYSWDENGNIISITANSCNLGATNNYWQNGYFTNINGVALGSSPSFTDTKNTAGSTDTSSKIYLVGAAEQSANPQTYSDNEVYTTSGTLTTKEVEVGGGSAKMRFNSTDNSIEFVFS